MDSLRHRSRRSFLKGLAVASAAPWFIPASALGAAGRPAASERIVLGAIGVGGMGTHNLRSFLEFDEVQVVAICDVDAAHAASAKAEVDKRYGNNDCRTYNDCRELIARGDLDAVSIATPDHWHAIPAIAAAKAGLDIYGEKPLAHNITEGRAVADAVRRYGRIWQTGSWQRSFGHFHHACELVRNGRIGSVKMIEVGVGGGHPDIAGTRGQDAPTAPPEGLDYDLWLGPAPVAPYAASRLHANWRWNLDYGGGILTDWGAHHIDIAHWGMGLDYSGPIEVEAEGDFPAQGLWNAPTGYDVRARYADGLTIHIATPYPNGIKWIGDKGWIFVNRETIDAEPEGLLREVIGPGEERLEKSTNHHGNFLDSIRTRHTTITPAEVAHRSITVAHLGNIAMMTKRRIQWDPATEKITGDPAASALLGRPCRAPWSLQ